jgi:hypothetical protein
MVLNDPRAGSEFVVMLVTIMKINVLKRIQFGVKEMKIVQGVSYSQKFRVKRGFANDLEVAISQFGSAKK